MKSPNFSPFFSKEERMRFAEIALGEAALANPSLFDDLRLNPDAQIAALEDLRNINLFVNLDTDVRYVAVCYGFVYIHCNDHWAIIALFSSTTAIFPVEKQLGLDISLGN